MKKPFKLFLFADDMILYVKSSKTSIHMQKKKKPRKTQFSKVLEFKSRMP